MGTKQGPFGAAFTNGEASAIENGEVLPQNAERLAVFRAAREEDKSYYVTKRIVSSCLYSHRQRRWLMTYR
jgi:hypothetical protein